MVNFQKTYSILIKLEGGYSNDPHDPGKETYKGISRKYNESWEGWKLIDSIKNNNPNNFKLLLEENKNLDTMVISFYKSEYWDYFDGDILPQYLANELFESSVNLGKNTTTKYLQQSLNILSTQNKLNVDGICGKNTIKNILNLSENDQKVLYNMINIFQGYRYIKSGNKKYIRGWLKRIDIIKS